MLRTPIAEQTPGLVPFTVDYRTWEYVHETLVGTPHEDGVRVIPLGDVSPVPYGGDEGAEPAVVEAAPEEVPALPETGLEAADFPNLVDHVLDQGVEANYLPGEIKRRQSSFS